MSLRSQLSKAFAQAPPALPGLKPLAAAAERVLQRWPDVMPNPPERDREQLVQRLKAHVAQNRWDGVTMSFVSAAARATFDEVRRSRPDLADLRRFFIDEIRASDRATFLGAMVSVYLDSFVPDAPHTRALAAVLDVARSRLGARWRTLVEAVPEILRANEAADAIARRMIGMTDPWGELKQLGLRSPHAPGMMEHAHLAYVALLEPRLRTSAELDRLFAWLKPSGQPTARMSGAAVAIDAVLGHWRSAQPPEQISSLITRSLVALYGDPRVQRGGAWAGVAPDRLAVIMRWLTGENIRFFMDVVSAVEDSHMWAPRRRFWLKLYEQHRVDAAWVAFSASGADYARRMLSARGSRDTLSYGHQTAGGARANTSLLIMKSGNKIIVEGSHSYKVHVFREADPRAPALYQREYDCERIRLTSGAEAKSHLGDWPSWVEGRI